jgi:hypothetical protein
MDYADSRISLSYRDQSCCIREVASEATLAVIPIIRFIRAIRG